MSPGFRNFLLFDCARRIRSYEPRYFAPSSFYGCRRATVGAVLCAGAAISRFCTGPEPSEGPMATVSTGSHCCFDAQRAVPCWIWTSLGGERAAEQGRFRCRFRFRCRLRHWLAARCVHRGRTLLPAWPPPPERDQATPAACSAVNHQRATGPESLACPRGPLGGAPARGAAAQGRRRLRDRCHA